MSSIAYEQLLCNNKQFEQQEGEQDGDPKLCHIRDSYEKTGGQQRQDKSTPFVFNIWWAVFVTVVVVTLGGN